MLILMMIFFIMPLILVFLISIQDELEKINWVKHWNGKLAQFISVAAIIWEVTAVMLGILLFILLLIEDTEFRLLIFYLSKFILILAAIVFSLITLGKLTVKGIAKKIDSRIDD